MKPSIGTLASFGAAAAGSQIITASVSAFLPPHLELLGAGPAMIGLLLALDPLGGLLVQPLINVLSDRLHLSWGRRLPFVIVGTLVACGGLLWLAGATTLHSTM